MKERGVNAVITATTKASLIDCYEGKRVMGETSTSLHLINAADLLLVVINQALRVLVLTENQTTSK